MFRLLASRLHAAVAAATILLFAATELSAHAVVPDGFRGDWSSLLALNDNVGMIVRNASSQGEFAWRDPAADERTDLGMPDAPIDLREVRVTGSASELAFLLIVNGTPNGYVPQFQITLDLDRVSGSGQSFLAGFADTQVHADAEWERLIQTQFNTIFQLAVLDETFNPVATRNAGFSLDQTVIEFTVPWSDLGLAGPPSTPIRFTFASFRSDASDNTVDVGGASISNALDVVSNYGNPSSGPPPNTFTEVGDAIINYAFDIWFDAAGEVYSPWLISEVLPNSGTPNLEWIELRNVSGEILSLDDVKVGDEETPDGTEAMRRFPSGFLAQPGTNALLALNATAFLAKYGALPGFEISSTSAATPDMLPYTPWSTGTFALVNVADEVLVLDRWDTVLDVLNYGAVAYGQTQIVAPAADTSIERNAGMLDRNNCSTDFFLQPSPNPVGGTVDVPKPQPKTGLALSAAAPNPCERATDWRLSLPVASTIEAVILDLMGRRIRRLERRVRDAGIHVLTWDLRDAIGARVPAGTYFARVEVDGAVIAARPVVVLR